MLKSNYYTEPTEIDRLIFEKLVPVHHYLRQVLSAIDFERFREQVSDCYSAGLGRGAEDPVLLIKLEFLQYHHGLSDRKVCEQAQVNVAFRLFLGLSLESKLPVPSLLSQFRTRLGYERHQALFDEVIAQARGHGLVKDRLRLKDATHIIANIAIPSTIQLIAQVRDRLLDAALPFAPDRVQEERVEAQQITQISADLSDQGRLLHRIEHLRKILAFAEALKPRSATDPPATAVQRLAEALALAHKVLADRQDPQPKDRLISATDPQARRGKHGDYFEGYLLDLSCDPESELITGVNVLPGNGDEAADAVTLIETEQQTHHNTITELSIDGIGWRGEVLRTLTDPDGLDLAVYVPPQPRPSDSEDRFTPDDFSLDESGAVLGCPGGETTTTRQRNSNDTGWQFSFRRRQCDGCRLQAWCVPQLPKAKGRSVIKNDYQAEYDAAWQRAKTARYDQVKKRHPRIERKLAEMVGPHQGRRARYRGLDKVKIQALLTGLTVNIKRIVKLLGSGPALPQLAGGAT